MKSSFFTPIFLCFLLALFPCTILAVTPGKVEGSVTDAETGKGVPFANVELLKSGDSTLVKAVVVAENGSYKLDDVEYGKYLLRISSLGYRREIVPEFEITPQKPAVHFGPTSLFTTSKALDEVTVIGHKLTGQLEEGKTVYTIKNKSAEFAQSGLELLRQLPDITVGFMSEDVKMAGSNNILFQVNGRKVDKTYLEQLSPSLVDKVEVITSPGAKYDSDVDAIINIILKKNMALGASGRLRLQLPTSGNTVLNKNNVNIDLYYKMTRFYISANAKVAKYKIENDNVRTTGLSSEVESMLTQTSTRINKAVNGGFNYGFDWFSNDKNAFSFFSSVQPNIPNKNKVSTYNAYTHDLITSRTLSNNNINDNSAYSDYSLYYKHIFGKNHEISFENYLSNRNSDHSTDYYEQVYLGDNVLSDEASNLLNQKVENKNKQYAVKADYMLPLSAKIKLSAGYNGYFIRSANTYWNKNSGFSDDIRYHENRQVAYTNLQWDLGPLNLQTGGRYEFSDIRIIHLFDTTNTYNYFLPSASAVYTLGKKHTLRMNYRRSVVRPGVNQLSPINYSDDSYLQSEGNPRLKPGLINRLEFTHRIQVSKPIYISYNPYINFIRNDIRQVTLPVSDSVTVRKFANVSNDIEYGLTLSGSASIGKRFSVSPSFTYFKRKLNALPEYGITEVSEQTSWRMNISTQLILPKEWVVFVEYNYNGRYIDLQTTTHSYYECVIGINKSITKQFNLSVFTLNPWNNRYEYDNRTITSGNSIQQSGEAVRYDYLVLVRLGYKFKIGKQGRQLDRQIEQEEGQGNKKGIL